jgi:hypothetical protein
LQGLNDPLHASLGLRSIGADDLDIQLLHGSSKLGQSVTGTGGGHIDPENAMFVAVESHRLAMLPEISFRCLGIAEKAFAFHKAQLEQFSGGIIDEHQQGTAFCSSFKPVMG